MRCEMSVSAADEGLGEPPFAADGVVANYPAGAASTQSQLYATLAGGVVTVQPGAVFLKGYYAEITASQQLTGVGTEAVQPPGARLPHGVLPCPSGRIRHRP